MGVVVMLSVRFASLYAGSTPATSTMKEAIERLLRAEEGNVLAEQLIRELVQKLLALYEQGT